MPKYPPWLTPTLLFLIAALVFAMAWNAHAATKVPTTMVCGELDEMQNVLAQNGEAVAALGSTGPDDSLAVQFWLDTSTREWTVMYVSEDKACMVAAGKNFRAAPRGGDKPAGTKS